MYCYDNIRKDAMTDTASTAPKEGFRKLVKLAQATASRSRLFCCHARHQCFQEADSWHVFSCEEVCT